MCKEVEKLSVNERIELAKKRLSVKHVSQR